MTYCSNCGTPVDGKFCQKCGKPVEGPATGTYSTPPAGIAAAGGIPANIASALCYIVPLICPIIFLLLEPYKRDRKVRFDAIQSLLITLVLFIADEAIGILVSGSLSLSLVVYRLLRLGEFVLVLYLAFKAFQNQKVLLPGIGPVADRKA